MGRTVGGMALALVLAACNPLSASQPPDEFLARRLDANSHLTVSQVAFYYRNGNERWRALGDGSYALDIEDRDPLTNEQRTINFLFEPVAPTRSMPEQGARITDLAINGQRLGFADVRATLQMLHDETNPPSPTLFPRRRQSEFLDRSSGLECAMEIERADFGPFTLADLDQAYTNDRQWTRYERPGDALDDGTPLAYIVYAANPEAQERVEFAVQPERDGVTLIGRQDFDQTGARSSWRTDFRLCQDTSEFIRATTAQETPAAETIVVAGIEPGMSYAAVRAALIASGEFEPIHVRYQARSCTDWTRQVCMNFNEFIDCSGTGSNICRLVFRRKSDGRLLVVNTMGEWSGDFGQEVGLHSMAWADLDLITQIRP